MPAQHYYQAYKSFWSFKYIRDAAILRGVFFKHQKKPGGRGV